MIRTASLTLAIVAATAAFPVAAGKDTCIQFSGPTCLLSGDLGFFRFKGALPKKAGDFRPLTGRVAGLSPVFGTATVAKDSTFIELAATFVADAVEGQFDCAFFPPAPALGAVGSGNANYGVYGVSGGACIVTVVDCALEP